MVRALTVHVGLLLAAPLVIPFATATAAYEYIESINGDLSGDNMLPTTLGVAMPGSNTVMGTVGNLEADIFSFVIPTGFQLDSIFLTSFSSSTANMFLSLDSGPTYEFSSDEINDQNQLPNLNLVLGSALVGTSPGVSVGDNILDNLGSSLQFQLGAGFTPPLPEGSYSVYIQETSAFSNYGLSFNVSAVPEPSGLCLLGGLVLGGCQLRRRRLSIG